MVIYDHFRGMNTNTTFNRCKSVTFHNSKKITEGCYDIYRAQSGMLTNICKSADKYSTYNSQVAVAAGKLAQADLLSKIGIYKLSDTHRTASVYDHR